MNRLLVALPALFIVAASTALAGPRETPWKKVQDALGKGLPKTAVAELEPIIAGAMADKAWAEAIKAVGQKIALEGTIQGEKAEEKILRLQTGIPQYPPEMKPALEAILAHWYWQYFEQNRYRFLQRTATALPPGNDLQSWDLSRILAEIDRHFSAALADAKTLQSLPVAAFDALLVKGSMPDRYRPTMFDFLAHEALAFYRTGEQGAAAAEDAFILDAGTPIFDPVARFIDWRPEGDDQSSPTLKAIRLYQQLLAFHRGAIDRDAFIDADLGRIVFGRNQASGEDKDQRCTEALKHFVATWPEHEISARALAEWGALRHDAGDLLEARRLAQRGLERHPGSVGATLCYNLVGSIEAKSASLRTERVWNQPWPTLDVTYRNVTRVFFRAVRQDFEKHLEARRWGLYNLDEPQRRELLSRRADLEWTAELPATTDFKERCEKLPSPESLQPGFYFIIASHDPAFGERENQISIAPIWVSDLALVMRQRPSQGAIEGFVLDALSGEPLPGALVRAWQRDNEGRFKPTEDLSSDRNGFFRLRKSEGQSRLIVASHHGRQLATENEWSVWQQRPHATTDLQTVFFTDRSLYRPGQTIAYKGIQLRSDHKQNRYETLAAAQITVTFLDPNGQEIARTLHQTNDYGSFEGVFTAPRDRLLGRMVIRGPNGESSINVEEYKRPKFQVVFDAPREASRLAAPVTLSGKATAYTGAAVGGAKVKWRVVRDIQLPPWCWWGLQRLGSAHQARNIAHGSALTGPDGSFTITFVARPDPAVAAAEEPTFTYRVTADVTDVAGETRSAERKVGAGFTALKATLAADEWQSADKPVALTVATTSRDGEPQAATGQVTIFALRQPASAARAALETARPLPRGAGEPKPDPANPDSWEAGAAVNAMPFATDARGEAKLDLALTPGIYRVMLKSADRFGQAISARRTIQVVDPRAQRFAVKRAHFLAAPRWSLAPGESFLALWGTGYDTGRAFVELECRGEPLRQFWTSAERTQELIEQAVTEEMRGGFTLRVTQVRENRAYLREQIVDVPWSNKTLSLRWEHFSSKLDPAQKETWSAVITGPDAQKAVAEMVAGLYDASLDQYRAHHWPRSFNVFRRETERVNARFENSALGFQRILGGWPVPSRQAALTYRSFPAEITAGLNDHGPLALRRSARAEMAAGVAMQGMLPPPSPAAPAPLAALADKAESDASNGTSGKAKASAVEGQGSDSPSPAPDLGTIAARRNLNETAFFFPRLLSDANGVVRMTFSMPEALTEWKFLGLAHDRELRSGLLEGKTITAKELMVEPNPPRFVREGDQIEFAVKVSNQSEVRQSGRLRLTMADARTLDGRDEALGNRASELSFDLPARESRSYTWRLAIPDGCGFLTYKAVGSTGTLSDGEEGFLPVLSRRILVSEALPLPLRGRQTKSVEFAKLLASGQSETLRHQALTVQMVSQPAWYAVMALPLLMEYPYECSEQVFNRLYANALARHIAGADPQIRRVFDQWQGTAALDSPLEKNQEIKAVMLEETPWLRQAKDETQARRNLGLLFDANRLDEQTAQTFKKLVELQRSDGRWSWFPGGWPSDYITLYIVTGFGRLRHLGVEIDVSAARRALDALDGWMDQRYRQIDKREAYVPGSSDALYLYGRSFFLQDHAIAAKHKEAVDFFLRQSRKFWLQVSDRQSQAHLALALKRFGHQEGVVGRQEATAAAIMRSLKERSVQDDELGMFWRDQERSWWWYRAPIETQAMMIEAFGEVMNDTQAVADCQVWLLKQKQTQDWRTTKATADAVYALLLGGANLLASDAPVEIALAGDWIQPEKVEAGTGFYQQRFGPGQIRPEMGKVTVKKTDDGVSWGSIHWQYLEEMTKVTPYQGTPLKLTKTLWVKETTDKGQVLKVVTGPLSIGDELITRIELRSDRDMEYVHLKDQRGSGTEPVSVLSRYKFQDGLRYYESTRDTASHFFIDYLPKGVYIFEYSSRIQHKGRYQSGIAEIQCMYAPEFNSHSGSHAIEVR